MTGDTDTHDRAHDDAQPDDPLADKPWYVVEKELWPLDEQSDLGTHRSRSMHRADSTVDAINAALYYARGRKSRFEVAYIAGVVGPFDDRKTAMDACYGTATGQPDAADQVLYLTTLRCNECGNDTTYTHEGPEVPVDQEAPWPEVTACAVCGEFLPDDLGAITVEVAEAERVAPHERAAGVHDREASDVIEMYREGKDELTDPEIRELRCRLSDERNRRKMRGKRGERPKWPTAGTGHEKWADDETEVDDAK